MLGLGIPITAATTIWTSGTSSIINDPAAPVIGGSWILALAYAYSGLRFGINRARDKQYLPNTHQRLDHLERLIQSFQSINIEGLTNEQRRQYRAIQRTGRKVRKIYESELQGNLSKKQMVKLATKGVTDKDEIARIKKAVSFLRRDADLRTREWALVVEANRDGSQADPLRSRSARWVQYQREMLERQSKDYKDLLRLIKAKSAQFREEIERGRDVFHAF